jgi:hypothetical protein
VEGFKSGHEFAHLMLDINTVTCQEISQHEVMVELNIGEASQTG